MSNVCYLIIDEADTFWDSGYGDIINGYVEIIMKR